MSFIDDATHYLFFTGKGGVGKTSIACASAVTLADRGRRVLIVSTDPASNLDAVLGVALSSHPTPIDAVPQLFALNIDPQSAAAEYRERLIRLYRGVVPDEEVARIEQQLAGACTVEIAAFDQFSGFLGDDQDSRHFDHVLFDTAPTGHTLRLLQLPVAWTEFLERNISDDALCTGPRTGLRAHQERYAVALETLTDRQRTTLVLVTRAERTALKETERTSTELESIGLQKQFLVVNAVFRASRKDDPVAVALERKGQHALEEMPERLRALPRTIVLLRGHNIVGIPVLRELLSEGIKVAAGGPPPVTVVLPALPSLRELVDEFATLRSGLIMIMGKGGVGKTTIAAAIAVELAARRLPVHLTTTDPAAHVTMTLETEVRGLKVSRIDPKAAIQEYRQRTLEGAKAKLDASKLALMEEDLRSPCTEEVAVFHAFSRIVSGAQREIVVMDTAPTGHTLLLLDATGAYHREIMRNFGARVASTPLTRLRDPAYTKVLVVTLPEPTPVLEAEQLQTELRRAGIEPFAWVINASMAAARPTDPILVQRAQFEFEQIHIVQERCALRVVIVPWQSEEPVGPERLRQLASGRSGEAN
jgi:arsenite/tail-anchored protein-transporting ATPase